MTGKNSWSGMRNDIWTKTERERERERERGRDNKEYLPFLLVFLLTLT